ncbi:hypothetical protein [Streptomyces sp. enrichment culture]|uniref:hypothetical protein n=1 Tax=Streptomyces sp. enrichment culture TaxID=1795815 RepID=UPI003F551D24
MVERLRPQPVSLHDEEGREPLDPPDVPPVDLVVDAGLLLRSPGVRHRVHTTLGRTTDEMAARLR